LTTFNEAADRVAMHAVRRALVEAQARAAALPLWRVPLPWPCSNADYQQRLVAVIARARDAGVTQVAFGDLFLQEIRDYRVRQLRGTGIDPLFPLWCAPSGTPQLARRMLEAGLAAVLTCVDPNSWRLRSWAAATTRPCSAISRPASIPAASAASSTRSATPGRCSRRRSPYKSVPG
jgi:diphthamide synthase (EF-2-diphthine--ammonia ligase)